MNEILYRRWVTKMLMIIGAILISSVLREPLVGGTGHLVDEYTKLIDENKLWLDEH